MEQLRRDNPGPLASASPLSRSPVILRSLPFPSLLLPSLLLLSLLFLPDQLTAHPSKSQSRGQMPRHRPPTVTFDASARHSLTGQKMAAVRQRRQTRPREGLFQLYWRLMTEASNDTQSAVAQIGQLFSKLIESERMSENLATAENTTAEAATGGGGDLVDGGGNVTTTTTEAAPRKISSRELMGIFRRNVFGLGRLFGREFWNAIQQSNKNVVTYTQQWQEALRPYLE